jgi:hypothetical protein
MTILEKYDKVSTGAISGILLPFIIILIVFFFAKGNPSMGEWLVKISKAGIETHVISLCVFPNIIIFLLFNQLDMLRASRGVLGVTIFWAIIVFAVYFLL